MSETKILSREELEEAIHHKDGTWIWRKSRTYCPQCGQRLSKVSFKNHQPVCENNKCGGRNAD